MPKSELKNRLFYGMIAAVLGGFVIYHGGYVFFGFALILAFIMSLEFDNMRQDGKVSFMFCALPILFAHQPMIALAMIAVALLAVLLIDYLNKARHPWLFITVPYICIPAISLIWLRDGPNGLQAVLWIVLVVISTDIGAYFVGKIFGKTLMAPSISPKKTWEGMAGGAVLAALVSLFYTGQFALAFIAIILAIVEQCGDLTESAIKRYFGVKDSGNILPGHGGVMDRLDGLLYTAPLAAVITHYNIIVW